MISPTNTVLTTITGFNGPNGVAVSPTGANAGDVYVTNAGNHKVSVIDPTTNSVVTTISVGESPQRVAVA